MRPIALDDIYLEGDNVVDLVSGLGTGNGVVDVPVLVVRVGDRLIVGLELIKVENFPFPEAHAFGELFVGIDVVPRKRDPAEGVLLSLFDEYGQGNVGSFRLVVPLELPSDVEDLGVDKAPFPVPTLDSPAILFQGCLVEVAAVEDRLRLGLHNTPEGTFRGEVISGKEDLPNGNPVSLFDVKDDDLFVFAVNRISFRGDLGVGVSLFPVEVEDCLLVEANLRLGDNIALAQDNCVEELDVPGVPVSAKDDLGDEGPLGDLEVNDNSRAGRVRPLGRGHYGLKVVEGVEATLQLEEELVGKLPPDIGVRYASELALGNRVQTFEGNRFDRFVLVPLLTRPSLPIFLGPERPWEENEEEKRESGNQSSVNRKTATRTRTYCLQQTATPGCGGRSSTGAGRTVYRTQVQFPDRPPSRRGQLHPGRGGCGLAAR